jgi:tetratricopeptide (TPR) repeat protein
MKKSALAAPLSSPPRTSLLFVAACVGAVLLFAAAYSNSLRNAFHFDDSHVIVQNIFIRDVGNIPRFFTDANTFSSLPQNATYRPLVSLTLALDYWFGGGLNPIPFHITQLLLFAATGAFLALLCWNVLAASGGSDRWPRWAALVAAALFCVHTANTQPGNYISARSELIAGMGVLGAFLVYLRWPGLRRYYLYLIPMVLGALAKNPAVMFAPLLIVYKLFVEEGIPLTGMVAAKHRARVFAVLRETAPALVVAVAMFFFVESMNPPAQTYGGGSRWQYLATQSWVWVRYARLFVLPTGLTADTDLTLFPGWDPRILAGVLMLIASLWAVARASEHREWRPVAFGLVWFWLALAPTSTIFPLAEVTNDHRMFFPYMGLCLAAVCAAGLVLRRTVTGAAPVRARATVAAALAIPLLGAHGYGTFERNKAWRSEATLWADVVKKSPGNGRGFMNYGLAKMTVGEWDSAKTLYTRAAQLTPNYALLEINQGILNDATGDTVEALKHFERALDLDPNSSNAHLYYAKWLANHGGELSAEQHLRRSMELSAADVEPRHDLMTLYAATADTAALKALAKESLNLASNDSVARAYMAGQSPLGSPSWRYREWYDVGFSLVAAKRHPEAAEVFRAALRFGPDSATAWNNLGWSLGKMGRYDQAEAALERAIKLMPDLTVARNNLAWVRGARDDVAFVRAFELQKVGRDEDAIAIYRELLQRSPNWVNAQYNFGYSLMTLGRCREAIPAFRHVLDLDPKFSNAHLHLSTCYQKIGEPVLAAQHRASFNPGGKTLSGPSKEHP